MFGVRHLVLSRRWSLSGLRWLPLEHSHDVGRQIPGVSQELAYLPYLLFSEGVFEAGHPGQPNSVLHLPVCFRIGWPVWLVRIVMGGQVRPEELWWVGIHALGNCSLGRIWQTVTDCAIFSINIGSTF